MTLRRSRRAVGSCSARVDAADRSECVGNGRGRTALGCGRISRRVGERPGVRRTGGLGRDASERSDVPAVDGEDDGRPGTGAVKLRGKRRGVVGVLKEEFGVALDLRVS